MSDTTTVTVRILDRDYDVSCPHDEVDGLVRAARSLSARMREIQRSGKVVGLDRIAVMAALNYAHEFLEVEGTACPGRGRYGRQGGAHGRTRDRGAGGTRALGVRSAVRRGSLAGFRFR